MLKYNIWWTNSKTTKISETAKFASQAAADAYCENMTFEDNQYWAELYPSLEQVRAGTTVAMSHTERQDFLRQTGMLDQ
jgi:hypothetical protein